MKKITKLIFTQDGLAVGGAERSHLEITSRFTEDVEVVFVYFYPKHDLKLDYERAGIRLFFLDIPESYHFHLAICRLVKLIRKEKPDLLVSSLWRADIITRIASKITGVPLVGTLVNDSYAPIAWTDKQGLKYKIVYWLDRLTAVIPIHWIANAQALADSHVKTLGIAQDKISVVYRGRAVPNIGPESGDVSRWLSGARTGGTKQSIPENQSFKSEIASGARDIKHKSNKIESTLAMTNGVRNFISYGRLLERKGFQDAINAFSEVIKKYPDCTLTIFGEGPYRANLESLIQELGLQTSVFLPGKIPNPSEVLISGYRLPLDEKNPQSTDHLPLTTHNLPVSRANCFLFPSWYEGFSGALVEAMMAGIPIIASDIPMNLEALTHKKSALVFSVKNIEHLTEMMDWAIENSNQMKVMGKEARKIAIERFNIDHISNQYLRVLKKVLNQQV